jgi:hypothetical protein
MKHSTTVRIEIGCQVAVKDILFELPTSAVEFVCFEKNNKART